MRRCPNSRRQASTVPITFGFSRRRPHPHSGAIPPAAVNLSWSTYPLRICLTTGGTKPADRTASPARAVNGSPDITSHAAQLASGCSHKRDQKPDNAPGQAHLLPSVTQEVMAVPAAPMVPAAPGELNDPQATDTSATLIVLALDSYSAQGLENSLELHTAGPNTATTFTRATHPVPPPPLPPPPKPKLFGIFMGRMGRHCRSRGFPIPAPKRSQSGREAAATKVVLDAPQESGDHSPGCQPWRGGIYCSPNSDSIEYGCYMGGASQSNQGI